MKRQVSASTGNAETAETDEVAKKLKMEDFEGSGDQPKISANPLLTALYANEWPRSISEQADEDMDPIETYGHYIQFYSTTEQRPVRLVMVHRYCLRDAETGEEFFLEGWSDEDHTARDDDSERSYLLEEPDIFKADAKKLSERFGVKPEKFRGETSYSFNQPVRPGGVDRGMIRFDHMKCLFQKKSLNIKELVMRDDLVPRHLRNALLKNVHKLRDSKEPDWHPGSKDIVNDIIHPILFPYEHHQPLEKRDDFFGRKYRDSKFQWLPADFDVDANLRAKLAPGSYINNMPEEGCEELIANIEQLVSLSLPSLEQVWQYARTAVYSEYDDPTDLKESYDEAPAVTFAGSTIQVIPKIAEYVFRKKGDFYEGVWHVEGLSHENIVATALYFLEMDPELYGGELEFKRAMTDKEVTEIYYSMPQSPPEVFQKITTELVPLGRVQTQEDRFLCFPNSHAHKLHSVINPTDSEKRRLIIVLFLVNPDRRITSTTGVERGEKRMTLERAKDVRRQMMEERKAAKEDLNGKEIEFCEH